MGFYRVNGQNRVISRARKSQGCAQTSSLSHLLNRRSSSMVESKHSVACLLARLLGALLVGPRGHLAFAFILGHPPRAEHAGRTLPPVRTFARRLARPSDHLLACSFSLPCPQDPLNFSDHRENKNHRCRDAKHEQSIPLVAHDLICKYDGTPSCWRLFLPPRRRCILEPE